jgi:hypothetical protein
VTFRKNQITGFFTVNLLVVLFTSFIQPHNTCSSRNDSTFYQNTLTRIYLKRDSLKNIINSSNNDSCLNAATDFLISSYYKKIVPCWLGTKWEFYGKTEIPRKNSIACGYFVVTSLRHLGLNFENPVAMAEDYSTYIVTTLCDTLYRKNNYRELLSLISQKPDDMWVIGLKNHSGIIVKFNGKIRFVHSSPMHPVAVVDEAAESSEIFKRSDVFVAGNLFSKNSLTSKWISGANIPFRKK